MFRFTIRELVLLTLVVAMGVGWWLDHATIATYRAKSEKFEAATRRLEAEQELLRKELAMHRNLIRLGPWGLPDDRHFRPELEKVLRPWPESEWKE